MLRQGCFFGADLAGLLAAGVAVAVGAEAARCAEVDVVDDTELGVAVCAAPVVAAEATPAAPAPSPAATTAVSIRRLALVAVTVAMGSSFSLSWRRARRGPPHIRMGAAAEPRLW
jgi:hypothetical protein